MSSLRPLSVVALLAGGLLVTAATRGLVHPPFVDETLVVEVLTLVAAITAAMRFEPDDPPRLAWMTLVAALAILVACHLATPFSPKVVRHALVFAHNLAFMAASFRFLRVVQKSGFVRPSSRRATAVLVGVGVVAAASVAWSLPRILGPVLAMGSDVTLYAAGVAAANGSGSLADAVVLVVAVALSRALWPMAGGSIAQPYVLLAVGAGALLVLDFAVTLLALDTYLAAGPAVLYLHAFAWTAIGTAGVSQAVLLHRASTELESRASITVAR